MPPFGASEGFSLRCAVPYCGRSVPMRPPKFPTNEPARLATLRRLDILDTPPEERFDRVTRLAKRALDVPIALVSLVDADRQWFKSRVGLDASETPRDISFCGHAILGEDIFIVPDALSDQRFHDNPLVVGQPQIRFYAGCPIRASDGAKLGTLCIIDRRPRTLEAAEHELLRDLASLVEQELDSIRLATVDELTEISNRRGFMALARQALAWCGRAGTPSALAYFDLDGFKEINDRFGHTEGDLCLQAFADALRQTFRESDVIGRLGGDEFAVLVTNAGSELVQEKMLRRLEAALNGHHQSANGGYRLLFSVGVAEFDPRRHRTLEQLVADGDSRMYSSKRERRLRRASDPASGGFAPI